MIINFRISELFSFNSHPTQTSSETILMKLFPSISIYFQILIDPILWCLILLLRFLNNQVSCTILSHLGSEEIESFHRP